MFGANNLLTVSYVGTAGHHLTTLYNFNRIPIGVGTENAPGLAGTPGCDAQGNCDVQSVLISQNAPPDFFVPYRGFTMMAYNPLNANSNYNALQVEFRHSIGRDLMFQASYTWSHALDNSSSDGNAPGVGDPNLDRWYADSDYNRAQMLVFNYVYNLPFFAYPGNALVRQALGGRIISGVTSFCSDIPVNTFGVCGIDGYSNGVGENVQCNTVGPLRPKKGVSMTRSSVPPSHGSTRMPWRSRRWPSSPQITRPACSGILDGTRSRDRGAQIGIWPCSRISCCRGAGANIPLCSFVWKHSTRLIRPSGAE